MEYWQERLVQENKELDEMITKLKAMICSDRFEVLCNVDQILLVQQLAAMKQYASALKARIKRFL